MPLNGRNAGAKMAQVLMNWMRTLNKGGALTVALRLGPARHLDAALIMVVEVATSALRSLRVKAIRTKLKIRKRSKTMKE